MCGGPAASSGFLAAPPGLNFRARAGGRDGNGGRNLGLGLEVVILSGLSCPAGSSRQVAECGGKGGNWDERLDAISPMAILKTPL